MIMDQSREDDLISELAIEGVPTEWLPLIRGKLQDAWCLGYTEGHDNGYEEGRREGFDILRP